MKTALIWTQVVVSVLLILSILSQERGAGLSATFGGTGAFFVKKRGADRLLSILTVVFAALFVLLSLAFIFIPE